MVVIQSPTSSTTKSNSSSKKDDLGSKGSKTFKFGQTERFKVGDNSIIQVTVNSAQKINSDNPAVEYMEEKGFAENACPVLYRSKLHTGIQCFEAFFFSF